MRPQDALQIQLRLKEDLQDSQYQDYMRDFLQEFTTRIYELSDVPPKLPNKVYDGALWCLRERERLEKAYTYLVSSDMLPVVEFAASTLDKESRYQESTLPTHTGFLVFESPRPFTNLFDEIHQLKAISWGWSTSQHHPPLGEMSGYWVTYFNESYTVVHYDFLAAGMEVGGEVDSLNFPFKIEAQELYDIQTVHDYTLERIRFLKENYPEEEWDKVLEGETRVDTVSGLYQELNEMVDKIKTLREMMFQSRTNDSHRFLFSLFTLMNQTIVDVSETRLTPKRVGYYRKKKIPGKITVVQLRRRVYPNSQKESLIEWSHRWVVRGHWRRQPIGPGLSDTKLVWISPYVKGPEDKPFVDRPKVYSLSR